LLFTLLAASLSGALGGVVAYLVYLAIVKTGILSRVKTKVAIKRKDEDTISWDEIDKEEAKNLSNTTDLQKEDNSNSDVDDFKNDVNLSAEIDNKTNYDHLEEKKSLASTTKLHKENNSNSDIDDLDDEDSLDTEADRKVNDDWLEETEIISIIMDEDD
jgi:hypothetical protein